MKKQFSKQTRQRMSEAAKARCTPEWRKWKSDQYAIQLSIEQVRSLYESGMTQHEVARVLGVSQKVIWGFMKRNGIDARRAVKRDQWGKRNSSWKGKEAGYAAKHLRVIVARGKPQRCEVCGTTDAQCTYDWSCINGNFDDIEGFVRMCRSCHWKHDKKINNIRQTRRKDARK